MENMKDIISRRGLSDSEIEKIKSSIPSIKPVNKPVYINKFSKEATLKEITEISRAKNKRELENNNNLKAIVQHNENISNYNKELVSLNEKILNKINSLDDTLILLNNTFNNKVDIDKEQAQEQTALLLELIAILDSKDKDKIKKFMENVSAPVGVGLIVEYLKIKLGIS
ncbi:hypothetical protein A0J52_02250 [Clostridium sporogenes]|uniref:hypothetical protein n=1 Tax=Clostridium TaxID=1485 RepID=UPI00078017E5|nr:MULTISPECIES: hypothetical protein [Clostridium]KYN78124.1 hypothetical protein A0J52_02250 [Clostridium sporogenes]MBE6056312.1 hypothetical protein [Clostridium sp.]NFM19144.1 hypothetical protein [Clostridium sporogenes]